MAVPIDGMVPSGSASMCPALPARTSPQYNSRRAGANTTPSTGSPFSMSATFTVNSSRWRDELARAIERIDQEETIGDDRHLAGGHGFFGDHRHAGRDRREIREDDFLRGFVGHGHRRASALSRTEKSVAYTAMMAPPARCAV